MTIYILLGMWSVSTPNRFCRFL